MFIKQISVFLENKVGVLREVSELLGRANIDMMALAVADPQSFGIVRIIVKDHEIDPALDILRANGYIAKVNNVICAEVQDKPMGLASLLAIIEEAGLSVEYMYSFLRGSTGGRARMILRLSDGQKGLKVFDLHGIRVLEQAEIDAL